MRHLDTLDAELRLLAAAADMEHLGNREREDRHMTTADSSLRTLPAASARRG